ETALPIGLRVRMRDGAEPGESMVSARAGAYGAGWGVARTCDYDPILTHSGAVDGFASEVALLPESGVGVIAMANFLDAELGPVTEGAREQMKKGGGLSKREAIIKLDPVFAPAMQKFLAVFDRWDESAYRDMLSPNRPAIPPESERRELAGYRSLHGDCSG